MDEREKLKRKSRSDTIWTFIIIAAFLTAWPIGIALAILKGKNILPDIGMGMSTSSSNNWKDSQAANNKQSANVQRNYTHAKDWTPELKRQTEHAKQQTQQLQEQLKRQTQQAKERTMQWAVPVHQSQQNSTQSSRQNVNQASSQKKKPRLNFGKPMFISGLTIGSIGLLLFADNVSWISGFGSFMRHCSFPLGLLSVGAYLTIYGLRRIRQSKRLQEYARLLPSNGKFYSIHELAERTGRPYRQVLADLQRMVELGVWARAWIDRKNGKLMFTAYEPTQQAEQSNEPQPKPEAVPKEDKQAEQVLSRIRSANDQIADEAISLKIDRIQLLTREIFAYLANHPEREGELRTFMDYYLPQTLKILETYAHLESQGVETDNIRKAKSEISSVLDQLTQSYELQLDKLFDTDVLDISADIEVMKQMLRSDGLAVDEMELITQKNKKH